MSMSGVIYTRFSICAGVNSFSAIADYSVDVNYSCPSLQPTIELFDHPVPSDHGKNCCERELLTKIFSAAKASYPGVDGWLILADCASARLEGIELDGAELLSTRQFAMGDDGYPSLDVLESLAEDFRGIRPSASLAAGIDAHHNPDFSWTECRDIA